MKRVLHLLTVAAFALLTATVYADEDGVDSTPEVVEEVPVNLVMIDGVERDLGDLKLMGDWDKRYKGIDFAAFKGWLAGLSDDQRVQYEHSLSESYIKRHGEEMNDIRVCANVQLNYTAEEFFVDQKHLRDTNFRYLDKAKYNDWVLNAPKGSKPWVVIFGDTAFGSSTISQPATVQYRLWPCVSNSHFKDKFNFGFMDWRLAEFVRESYAVKLAYSQGSPYLMIFDDGVAYHTNQGSFGTPEKATTILSNYKTDSVYEEPMREARNQLTILYEYAKNDLHKIKPIKNAVGKVRKWFKEKDSWVYHNYFDTLLTSKSYKRDKGYGEAFILYLALPLVLVALSLLYILLKLFCRCCCGSAKPTQVSTPGGARNRQKVD